MSFFSNPRKWPEKPLIEVASLKRGYDLPVSKRNEGSVPIFAANGQNGTHDEAKVKGPGVVTGRSGTIGKVHYVEGDYWPLNTSLYVTDFYGNDPKWVFYMLSNFKLERYSEGAGVPTLNRNLVHGEMVPVPPLAEQKRISSILDKADAIRRKRQKAIRLVDEFLRAVFLDMFGDPVTNPKALNKVKLGDLIKVASGNGLTAAQMDPSGSYKVYGGNGVNGKHSEYMFAEPKLVIGRVGVYCGSVHMTEPYSWVTDNALYVKELKTPINIDYLEQALKLAELNQYSGKAAQPLVSGNRIYPVEILLPEESEQLKFSEIKEKFIVFSEKIVNGSKKSEELFLSLSQLGFSGEL